MSSSSTQGKPSVDIEKGATLEDMRQAFKSARVRPLAVKNLKTAEHFQSRTINGLSRKEELHEKVRRREHIGSLRSDLMKSREFDEALWVAQFPASSGKDKFIISGHHRLAAYQAEKVEKAKVKVLSFADITDAKRLAMVENRTHEKSLKLMQAQLIESMWQELLAITTNGQLIELRRHGNRDRLVLPNGITQQGFALEHEVKQSTVSNHIKLAYEWGQLNPEQQAELLEVTDARHEVSGKITARGAREVLAWTVTDERDFNRNAELLKHATKVREKLKHFVNIGGRTDLSFAEVLQAAYWLEAQHSGDFEYHKEGWVDALKTVQPKEGGGLVFEDDEEGFEF